DSTGRTIWRYPEFDPPLTIDLITKTAGHLPVGNLLIHSGFAIAPDGTLYAGAAESRVIAVSSSGSFQWEFKTKPGINRATPLISNDGTIYVASGSGDLYALYPGGTQKWELQTEATIDATPVIASDGTIYLVNNGALIAVSPEGKQLAQVSFGVA